MLRGKTGEGLSVLGEGTCQRCADVLLKRRDDPNVKVAPRGLAGLDKDFIKRYKQLVKPLGSV